MPNPIISPSWGVDLTYTVTDSDDLAVEIRLAELDEEPAQIDVTVPAGAAVRAVRDPGAWSDAGVEVLGGGGWAPGPVAMGNWTLTVSAGAAVTDPATLEITNVDGLAPTGLLRLVFTSLAGAACNVAPAGGTFSIDRLLADPSIINPQVSTGLPVHELDAVQLTATAQATVEENPAPSSPLPVLPSILSAWEPEPGNPVAVTGFTSTGTTADFTAPAAYSTVNLEFRLTVAYDIDASGTINAGDPRNEHVLPLQVETVTHGMLLVLDRSGSMGSSLGSMTKWDATVQAAHAWLDLFRSFRSGVDHKAGVITFEHDGCDWTEASTSDVTLRDPETGAPATSMSSLSAFGDVTVLDLGTDTSCTPIGDALVKGLEALQSGLLPGNVASVVLLTDGYENSGRVTIAAEAGAAATTFAQERVSPGLSFGNDLVGDRLFTIAVGASVDEDRLNDLPNPPGSGTGPGYYRLTTDVAEILPTFADMLGMVLDAQRMMPTLSVTDPESPSHAVYFDVPTGEQRVALLVPWSSATHNLRVAWRQQGSSGSFTVVNPADAAVVGYWRRQFHGLMTVDLTILSGSGTPPATEWRVQHMDAGDVPQPLTDADLLCMIDLVTKAEIRFDEPQYFTGDPIRISCSIRSGGRRVVGASVGIDVAGPGEGLGTFLATNAGPYKKIRGDHDDRDPRPRGPDPDQGKGLMFKTLLQLKQMEGLPVVTPPSFFLHDDGAHDDGAAGDGDYANSFADTQKEGTYTFRFRIEGTLDDGSRFSRLFVRSTWVGVKPDPVATTTSWTALTGLPAGQVGHLMTMTPKSAGGEFLGPFRAGVIQVQVSDGTLDGPLVDNLDGSYSQRVIYRPSQNPIVSVDVYGIPMRPTGPGLGQEDEDCFRLLIRALGCLLRKLLRLIFRRGS